MPLVEIGLGACCIRFLDKRLNCVNPATRVQFCVGDADVSIPGFGIIGHDAKGHHSAGLGLRSRGADRIGKCSHILNHMI